MVGDDGEGGAGAAPPPLFELSRITATAGDRTILGPVDLSIGRGEITGLIGPNGSGKSTLVKILARQAKSASGTVRFEGRDIAEGSDRAFARRLAYLPQFTPAADGMTVEELVALGRFPWHGTLGRTGPRDREAVAEAIAHCELSGLARRLVDSLSGGERQRVWLAMMLAQETNCLVLDEPTSALDVAHQADMLGLVGALARTRALSVVIVLHDINMAARLCHRLVALKDGRVVADAAPGGIMVPEVLQRIYGIAMGIFTPPGGAPVGYVP